MLTPQQKVLASELLNALTLDDLLMIAKTTTNRIMNPKSKEEALQIITSYEEDPRTLLNRKKVTKVLLFNYLHWKKVAFPGNADKTQLVEIVVKFWEDTAAANTDSNQAITGNTALSITGNQFSSNAISHSLGTQQILTNPERSIATASHPGADQQISLGSNMKWVDVMSFKFVEWFYSMINRDFDEASNLVLKEDDFWNDSAVFVKIISGSNVTSYEASNSSEAVAVFRGLKREHNLNFLPNMTEQGVKGKLDPHGIVLVAACGTLYQGVSNCVGIFQQMFSLIRDPIIGDNWKVKRTDLNIKTQSNIIEPPTLENGDFTNAVVAINEPD